MTEFDDDGFIAGRPVRPEQWASTFKGLPPGRYIANNTMPPGILVVKNCLDPAWCDAVVRECENVEGERHTIGVLDEDAHLTYERSGRRTSDTIRAQNLNTDISKIVRRLFVSVVAPYYQAQIDWFELPDILRYRQEGEYRTHADAQLWDRSEKSWKQVVDRDLSLLVYLNNEFEGGDLVLPNFDFGLKPARGLLVAFPSDGRYIHSARPVTSGVRYVLVSWAAVKGGPRVKDAPPPSAVRVQE